MVSTWRQQLSCLGCLYFYCILINAKMLWHSQYMSRCCDIHNGCQDVLTFSMHVKMLWPSQSMLRCCDIHNACQDVTLIIKMPFRILHASAATVLYEQPCFQIWFSMQKQWMNNHSVGWPQCLSSIKYFCSHTIGLNTSHDWIYSPAETGEYPGIFPKFQDCMCCEEDLRDNKHNRLHLTWKYAWIFVLGHHLFLDAPSFPCAMHSENFSLLGTDVNGQKS